MWVSISERFQRVLLPNLTGAGISPAERRDQTVRTLTPSRSATSPTGRRRSDLSSVLIVFGGAAGVGVVLVRLRVFFFMVTCSCMRRPALAAW